MLNLPKSLSEQANGPDGLVTKVENTTLANFFCDLHARISVANDSSTLSLTLRPKNGPYIGELSIAEYSRSAIYDVEGEPTGLCSLAVDGTDLLLFETPYEEDEDEVGEDEEDLLESVIAGSEAPDATESEEEDSDDFLVDDEEDSAETDDEDGEADEEDLEDYEDEDDILATSFDEASSYVGVQAVVESIFRDTATPIYHATLNVHPTRTDDYVYQYDILFSKEDKTVAIVSHGDLDPLVAFVNSVQVEQIDALEPVANYYMAFIPFGFWMKDELEKETFNSLIDTPYNVVYHVHERSPINDSDVSTRDGVIHALSYVVENSEIELLATVAVIDVSYMDNLDFGLVAKRLLEGTAANDNIPASPVGAVVDDEESVPSWLAVLAYLEQRCGFVQGGVSQEHINSVYAKLRKYQKVSV